MFGSSLDVSREANDIDLAMEGVSPRDFFRFYGELILTLSKPVDVVDLSGRSKFLALIRHDGVPLDLSSSAWVALLQCPVKLLSQQSLRFMHTVPLCTLPVAHTGSYQFELLANPSILVLENRVILLAEVPFSVRIIRNVLPDAVASFTPQIHNHGPDNEIGVQAVPAIT